VGALETAFQDSEEGSVAPSVVGSLQDHDAHHAHEVPIHTPGGEEGHHHERHIVPHEDGPGFLHGEAVVTASAKLAMQAVGIPVPDVVARIPTAVEESGDSTRPGSSKRSSRSNTRPSSGKGNKGAHVHGHIHGHIHAGKDSNKGSPSAARGTMHSKQRRRSFDGRAPSPHLSHDSSFGGTPSDKSMGSVGSLGSHGEKRHTVAFGSSVTTARRPSLDGLTDLRKVSLEAVSPAALRAPLPSRNRDHITPPKHSAAHVTQLSPIAVGASASAHSPSPAAPPTAMSPTARPPSAKSPSRPTSVKKAGGAGAEGAVPPPQRSPSAGRRAGTQVAVRSPTVPTVTVTASPAVRSGRKTVVPSSPTAAAASGSSAQVVFTDTINTSDVAAAEKVTAETVTAAGPAVSIQPFSRPTSATIVTTPTPVVVLQVVVVRASADADDAVSAIEEASVEFTAVSTPIEQRRSNAPSRAKMVFSDDLLPSPREGDEDDDNSEMSPQQYADEHGRAVFYSADGRPILGHHELSLSAAATPSAGSAIHSPRSAGSQNHPRRHRGETFDETASSVARAMMDNISHEMSTELEPPFEGYEAPERYLPEKGLRDAIFGGDIDMGAAGLVSFLQSFASSGKPSEGSKMRPKKEAEPVQEQGYVAVPIGGEWKLQPSGAGASISTYSPKMRPLSPGGANKRVAAGLSPQPNITLPSPQQPPPQSFLLEGTAVTTSHRPKEDFLKLKVPALSPTDHRYVRRSAELPLAQPCIATPQLSRNIAIFVTRNITQACPMIVTASSSYFPVLLTSMLSGLLSHFRRLALKLGLDVEQQHALEQAAARPDAAAAEGTEVNADLLGLVREFYLEKQREEEKLEAVKKRAVTTYFPPSFRQNQNISQDNAGAGGDYHHSLAELLTDDHSEHSDADALGDEYLPRIEANVLSPVPIGHVNSLRTPHFVSHDTSPDQSGKFSRLASTKHPSETFALQLTVPSQPASPQHHAQYTSKEILAAVATVAAAVTPAQPAASAGQGRKLSVRMEQMLSRRSSFNPTEVRLELLESIHSPVSGCIMCISLFGMCDVYVRTGMSTLCLESSLLRRAFVC
jgi:hypothetical protein